MSDTGSAGGWGADIGGLLTRLAGVLDELTAASLTSMTQLGDEEVLVLWAELERARRRSVSVEHAIIAQVQQRQLAHAHAASSVAVFARQLLRITPGEAAARVRGADAAGPRVTLSGQTQAPLYPVVAAAQAAGDISAQHAALITSTIDALPAAAQADTGAWTESFLVEQAGVFDPVVLATITTRIRIHHDLDTTPEALEHRRRRRSLNVQVRPDGSAHLDADLTAETTEHLRTALDTLARPHPATDGARDPRTPTQRRHDGLLELLKLVERSAQLPHTGGITTTVILTAEHHDWQSGRGAAITGHGVTIPVSEAARWTDGETRIFATVLDTAKRITAYSSTHRIFTETQRLAMIARDLGCSFPGCDAPPTRCQAHHVRDHAAGGPTSTDNGTLLCNYHHREHTRLGWTCRMTHGTPHWIPPRWLDPDRSPRQNRIHDPTRNLSPV